MTYEPTSPLPSHEPKYGNLGRYGGWNLAVVGAQIAAWAGLLTAIELSSAWWLKAIWILVLCGVLQGVFTMMHEYFHGNAHKSVPVNYGIGLVGSLLFVTSPTLHRINHWGHHVRNRTTAERGEYIHDGESAVQKTLLYYFATMGGLWLGGLIFPLASLFIPYSSVAWLKRSAKFNTYSAAFAQFDRADWTRMRLEALVLMAFWGIIITVGPWSLLTLALAYAAFAYHWSVLQWIYHLRTPIDVVEGAYNLRVTLPVRWLWLNFNCNLTHHRHPAIPWQELHTKSDWSQTQPIWYRYLLMWLPPTRFPKDVGRIEKNYF